MKMTCFCCFYSCWNISYNVNFHFHNLKSSRTFFPEQFNEKPIHNSGKAFPFRFDISLSVTLRSSQSPRCPGLHTGETSTEYNCTQHKSNRVSSFLKKCDTLNCCSVFVCSPSAFMRSTVLLKLQHQNMYDCLSLVRLFWILTEQTFNLMLHLWVCYRESDDEE